MAFAPIAFVIPEYDRNLYSNWWLKAYEPGTTTPKSMATDQTGSSTASRYELNTQGFPITAGNALVVPHVDGDYDLWLFPTAAEADANDTTNALQFADNLGIVSLIESISNTSSEVVLSADTVADLKTKDLQPGQTISTKGYYSAGDGGGANYLIVTPQAADEYGDHTLVNGNVATLTIRTSLNAAQYGAISNQDSTNPLKAFFVRVGADSIPWVISERYIHSEVLSCVSSGFVSGEFTGNGELVTDSSMTDDVSLWISWLPYLDSASLVNYTDPSIRTGGAELVTDVVEKQDRTITVSDGSLFSDGQYIRIASTDQYVSTRTQYKKGELRKVYSVSGNILTLDGCVDDSYTAATTKVFPLMCPKVDIKRPKLTGPDNENDYKGLVIWECADVKVANPDIQGYNNRGLDMAFVNGYELYGALVDRSQKSYVGSNRTSYSFQTLSSRDGVIIGGQFKGGRHSFATGGFDPNRNIRLFGAAIYSNDNDSNDVAALDSHENIDGFSVSQCVIYGGVDIAGQNMDFSDNSVYLSSEPIRCLVLRVAKSCDYLKANRNNIISTDGSCLGGIVVRPIDDSITVETIEQSDNQVTIKTEFNRPGIGIEPPAAGTNFQIKSLYQERNNISILSDTANPVGIGCYDIADAVNIPVIEKLSSDDNKIDVQRGRCLEYKVATGEKISLSDNVMASSGDTSVFSIDGFNEIVWDECQAIGTVTATDNNRANQFRNAQKLSLYGGKITFSYENGYRLTNVSEHYPINVTRENCTIDAGSFERINAPFIVHSQGSIDGSTGNLLSGFNCSSSRVGVGIYDVTFTERQFDSSYCLIPSNDGAISNKDENGFRITYGADTSFSFVTF